jgi:hypothetical protein
MGSGGCCWPERGGSAVSTVTCCARGLLAAADGAANAAIARDLAITVDTVRKWRRRFCEHGLDGCATCREPGGHARSRPQWSPR